MRYFDRAQLDRAFNARSVAVIGAKRGNGYSWLRRFETFAGTLSSVHVNPESIKEIEAKCAARIFTPLRGKAGRPYERVEKKKSVGIHIHANDCLQSARGR